MKRWLQRLFFQFVKDYVAIWLADRVSAFALSHPDNRKVVEEFLKEVERDLYGQDG